MAGKESGNQVRRRQQEETRRNFTHKGDGYDWMRARGMTEEEIHHEAFEGHNQRLLVRERKSTAEEQ